MARKIFISVALLAMLFLVLSGCGFEQEPEYMSIDEAADEYGWTKADFEEYVADNFDDHELWELCRDHVDDEYNLRDYIANEYEPEELLDHAPYTDWVMSGIVLDLYRNDIITRVLDEYSIDELLQEY